MNLKYTWNKARLANNGWQKELSDNLGGRDNSIIVIRLISLLMIIMCHMFQFFQMELAWWLNVGVQIFLCISGYLYGQKKIINVVNFYKHRLLKILVPYYIVFIAAGVLQYFFAHDEFSLIHFGGGLVCRTTITGGGHLWFVSTILMCYVITPLLNCYRDRYIYSSITICFYVVIGVIVVSVIFGLFAPVFNPAWMSCYILGYILGVNADGKYISNKFFIAIFMFFTFIGNGIQIYIDYIKDIEFNGNIGNLYKYFCNYNHVCLGVLLFLKIYDWLSNIDYNKYPGFMRILSLTDKYSYECYLVHQFLILGPFSLMMLTTSVPVNVIVIVCGICFAAWILKKIEVYIYYHVFKIL